MTGPPPKQRPGAQDELARADFGRLGSVTGPGFDFGRLACDEARVQADRARLIFTPGVPPDRARDDDDGWMKMDG